MPAPVTAQRVLATASTSSLRSDCKRATSRYSSGSVEHSILVKEGVTDGLRRLAAVFTAAAALACAALCDIWKVQTPTAIPI